MKLDRLPSTSACVLALAGVISAAVSSGASHAASAQAPPAGEPRPERTASSDAQVEALMKRFRDAQAATKTMAADFRQVKEDELFAEPRVQTGHFLYTAPGNFRWDYLRPDEVTVLITADTIQRYVPKQKLVQRMAITKGQHRIFTFFGIGSDVEILRRHFDVTLNSEDRTHGGADELELRGKSRRVQKRLKVVEMWIDRTTSLPSAIRAVMADGSSTTWEFTAMRINPSVPTSAYRLDVPKDVMVRTDTGKAGRLIDGVIEEDDAPASPSGN